MAPTDLLVMGGALLCGLAILGAGLYVASIGLGRVRIARRLREAGSTAVGDLPDATGLVAFEGTARTSDEGTLEAPLSGAACLAYTVESRSRPATGAGTAGASETESAADADETWTRDGRASAGVPFAVADGGDRVVVDPTDAVLSLSDWDADGTPWTDRADLSAAARDRLATVGLPGADAAPAADASASSDDVYQYREHRLEPGADVHVFGGSVADADRSETGDAPVTVGGGDWFEVSTGGRSRLLPDRHRSGSMYVIFGGLLAIPGLGFTLAGIVGLISTLVL